MKLDAYEKEIISYARELVGYLIKNGANQQDAQDMSQDALVKILEIDDQLPANKIKPWLFRVGINRYYNLYHRKKRYQELLDQHFSQPFQQSELVAYDNIYEVLAEMSHQSANLLLMKYEQELSLKEMAFILDRPIESLKTELYRARNQYKKIAERKENHDNE